MNEPQRSIAEINSLAGRVKSHALMLYAIVYDLLAMIPMQDDPRVERALRVLDEIDGPEVAAAVVAK